MRRVRARRCRTGRRRRSGSRGSPSLAARAVAPAACAGASARSARSSSSSLAAARSAATRAARRTARPACVRCTRPRSTSRSASATRAPRCGSPRSTPSACELLQRLPHGRHARRDGSRARDWRLRDRCDLAGGDHRAQLLHDAVLLGWLPRQPGVPSSRRRDCRPCWSRSGGRESPVAGGVEQPLGDADEARPHAAPRRPLRRCTPRRAAPRRAPQLRDPVDRRSGRCRRDPGRRPPRA